jgi:hypothetical protein
MSDSNKESNLSSNELLKSIMKNEKTKILFTEIFEAIIEPTLKVFIKHVAPPVNDDTNSSIVNSTTEIKDNDSKFKNINPNIDEFKSFDNNFRRSSDMTFRRSPFTNASKTNTTFTSSKSTMSQDSKPSSEDSKPSSEDGKPSSDDNISSIAAVVQDGEKSHFNTQKIKSKTYRDVASSNIDEKAASLDGDERNDCDVHYALYEYDEYMGYDDEFQYVDAEFEYTLDNIKRLIANIDTQDDASIKKYYNYRNRIQNLKLKKDILISELNDYRRKLTEPHNYEGDLQANMEYMKAHLESSKAYVDYIIKVRDSYNCAIKVYNSVDYYQKKSYEWATSELPKAGDYLKNYYNLYLNYKIKLMENNNDDISEINKLKKEKSDTDFECRKTPIYRKFYNY